MHASCGIFVEEWKFLRKSDILLRMACIFACLIRRKRLCGGYRAS